MTEMTDSNPASLYLILAAAGSSTRMGAGTKKEYLSLKGGTVLSTAASVFLNAAHFESIIITIPEHHEETAKDALYASKNICTALEKTPVHFVTGGNTRQSSVFKALDFIITKLNPEQNAIVLIHDAARPFVTEKIITDTITAAKKFGASVPAIAVVDTQKQIAADNTIEKHLVRSSLKSVQTPQAFLLQELFQCHKKAGVLQKEFTDDTEIWDAYPECTGGKKVHLVEGSVENKKITYRSDLAEFSGRTKMLRTGFGTDLHRLIEGRKFILGGIEIPSDKGELGHSDGDVLLHAIADALLGAARLGDIGSYFPPEDEKWRDAASGKLLQKVWDDVKSEGWNLINLDCVLEFEKPKFLPYRDAVIKNIAALLDVDEEKIFVKAKTNEKLDSIGNGEAIKAYCSCLLEA